jgi:nucleoside-diphosphate-sugar epimerase
MKVFVAGASGAVGPGLIKRLVEAGHEVTGSTRGGAGAERIREAGAAVAVCDVFDLPGFTEAVSTAEPEVVINQLTSLPPKFEPAKKGFYEANNRIRSEGGDNVIAATAAAGARRLVTQSISFLYELTGPTVKTEADQTDTSGTHAAMLGHEQKALGDDRFEAIVLRYGLFYGPGTWYARDGYIGEQVLKRRLPVVGKGTGIASFVHIDDAAAAAALVVDQGTGVYNVTDDEPAPLSEWLPAFAAAIGAKPPRRVPFWLASMVAGKQIATQALMGHGASNAKFKDEFGWQPEISSWRRGFQTAV